MTLPNFIGIGAAKAGTTWLSQCLGEHPDVFIAPMKETEFWKFADAEQRLDEYAAHFTKARNELAIGEFSVRYLSLPGVPERIHRVLPSVRLILSLRNPVDQVYSNYWHLQRQNFHLPDRSLAPRSIEEALQTHREFLLGPARYADHLERWLAQFPREQFLIIMYDDIEARPVDVLPHAFEFLGVDPNFEPTSVAETGTAVRRGTSPRSERAGELHSKLYDTLVRKIYNPLKRTMGTRRAARIKDALRVRPMMEMLFMREGYPPLDDRTRALLTQEFTPEIERLSRLTGLNFDSWK